MFKLTLPAAAFPTEPTVTSSQCDLTQMETQSDSQTSAATAQSAAASAAGAMPGECVLRLFGQADFTDRGHEMAMVALASRFGLGETVFHEFADEAADLSSNTDSVSGKSSDNAHANAVSNANLSFSNVNANSIVTVSSSSSSSSSSGNSGETKLVPFNGAAQVDAADKPATSLTLSADSRASGKPAASAIVTVNVTPNSSPGTSSSPNSVPLNGRIVSFIRGRTLRAPEWHVPAVIAVVAYSMGRMHALVRQHYKYLHPLMYGAYDHCMTYSHVSYSTMLFLRSR